jgi:hypothetical protein
VFLFMGAVLFFVAARTLPRGSRGTWIVCLILAINLVAGAVGEDDFWVIDGVGAAAGAVLIVSLLWPATIRFIWDEPSVVLTLPAADRDAGGGDSTPRPDTQQG